MKILMVAAENGALPGGKVGGMGDVIRDVPNALAEAGHQVDVLMPGYQRFSKLPHSMPMAHVNVAFRGMRETLELFDVPAGSSHNNVRCRVLEHPLMAKAGAGQIYCNDPPQRPFASDASKFALFCVGVVQALVDGVLDDYDVIHLHDWHSALVAVLIRYHLSYRVLTSKRLVFTIHNLSLQGIRPLYGDESSLMAWLPELICDFGQVRDLRYSDCFNPMRAAIRLCDSVHAVSPTYAQEIQNPSLPEQGFVGGEGLESDLREAARQGRLKGILNGCEYPSGKSKKASNDSAGLAKKPNKRRSDISHRPELDELLSACGRQLETWIAAKPSISSADFLALRKLDKWISDSQLNPTILITSVGRLTAQKVLLLRQLMSDGRTALEHLLDRLEGKGLLILLGSGDTEYEQFFNEKAIAHNKLLFLNGYAEALSQQMYESGDLFLMPSSFEPCGISQMLAMRVGQPCLVHGVGGLLDTVKDGETGFVFQGNTPFEQAQNMLASFDEVVELKESKPAKFRAIAEAAAAQRFFWSDVANQYVSELYQ